MKCFGFIPVYMSSIIIAIFNIVFGISDLIYMIHAYSKLDNLTTLENVFILLSVTYIFLQICLIYGLVRKKPKIILIWILLEAIMLVVSLQSNLFIWDKMYGYRRDLTYVYILSRNWFSLKNNGKNEQHLLITFFSKPIFRDFLLVKLGSFSTRALLKNRFRKKCLY